jgi:hypothetical protein
MLHHSVMRGLDPRIHDEVQHGTPYVCVLLKCLMDCRVKPGNDHGNVVPHPAVPAMTDARVHPLLNHAAGDAAAGFARRIGLVVVAPGMDHDG